MKSVLLLSSLLLPGCGLFTTTIPDVQIRYVKIEVPGPAVPCNVPDIQKPPDLIISLKSTDNIHYKVKTLLADREFKKAYILKLETAVTSCNQSK